MASGNGNKDGFQGVERLGRTGNQTGRPALPPGTMTPEQGCLSCMGGVGMLLGAVLFWAFIFWWNEPSFHAKPNESPAPTVSAPALPRGAKPGFAPR